MTVRTEKIQALTGSAPLTLPSTLPSSSKGVQVSTTGVVSAPDVATKLTNLTSSTGSNPGWVLLSHEETEGEAEYMNITNSSAAYPASDIYCYEVKFHIAGYYNNTASNIRISPMVNGVRKPNGSGIYGQGFRMNAANGIDMFSAYGNGTGTTDDYMARLQYKRQGMTNPTNKSYAQNFNKSTGSYSGTYGGDGGAQGSFRFYNGSGYQAVNIDPVGYFSRYVTGNAYQYSQWASQTSSMPVSNQPTHTAKVDGFSFFDSSRSSGVKLFGYLQLWGMPKTVT